MIDVATPANRNVVHKEEEKKLKYKSFGKEVQRMWNLKCTMIPVIVGATGIVTNLTKKTWKLYKEHIPLIHYRKQLYLKITHNAESTTV
jgi:hypothetical protein